jgi:hypothetical protein
MNMKRCLVIMAIAVLLLAPSCTSNYPPTITALESEAPGWTAPSGSLQVTCNASDPKGSELSYNWSASGGNISGTGPEVIWTAPEEVGMYDITVVVVNNVSLSATKSIGLTASIGPPPSIENMTVTAIDNSYLRETNTGYEVAQRYNYTIECIASGNGTLSYNWTCTGGNISEGGNNITWTAPDTKGDFMVTVKVFDGAGNWVKNSVVFIVMCTCGFQ